MLLLLPEKKKAQKESLMWWQESLQWGENSESCWPRWNPRISWILQDPASIFITIFNLSLAQAIISTCLKKSITVPIPKPSAPVCLHRASTALTSIAMKCFEGLVKDLICSSLLKNLDPLQFAYRNNRLTSNAIAHIVYTILSHLDKKQGKHVKVLFIDFSTACTTIHTSRLTGKLKDLGSLCKWIGGANLIRTDWNGGQEAQQRFYCLCTVLQ